MVINELNLVFRYTPFQFSSTTRAPFRAIYDPSRYDPSRYDPSLYVGRYNPARDNSGRYIPDDSGKYK